ncbi:MAG: flagellar hook-length control protein FliK [Pseudomonadota bacterium]
MNLNFLALAVGPQPTPAKVAPPPERPRADDRAPSDKDDDFKDAFAAGDGAEPADNAGDRDAAGDGADEAAPVQADAPPPTASGPGRPLAAAPALLADEAARVETDGDAALGLSGDIGALIPVAAPPADAQSDADGFDAQAGDADAFAARRLANPFARPSGSAENTQGANGGETGAAPKTVEGVEEDVAAAVEDFDAPEDATLRTARKDPMTVKAGLAVGPGLAQERTSVRVDADLVAASFDDRLSAEPRVEAARARADAAAPQTPTSIEAARQVVSALRTTGPGEGVEVRLDPPELGKVRINLMLDRTDAVTAVVTAERGDTLDLLRRHADELVKELMRGGYASVDLDFQSGGREFAGDQGPGEDGSFERAQASATGAPGDAGRPSSIVYTRARVDARLDKLV